MFSGLTNSVYSLSTNIFGESIFPSVESMAFSDTDNSESNHRFLSHTKPIGAPLDGKNITMRAAEDSRGYCIEYRETTEQHFKRYGEVWKGRHIGFTAIGMTTGMELASLGVQGSKGDVDRPKPSFINIPGVMFWNAWKKLEGMPKEDAMRAFIALTDKLYRENDVAFHLEDPGWPGPKYYDDCKKFSWVEVLVKSHKSYYISNNKDVPDWKKIQAESDRKLLLDLKARQSGTWHSLAYATLFLQTLIYSS